MLVLLICSKKFFEIPIFFFRWKVKREKSKYKKILSRLEMGDPKRLEALLSSGQGQDGEQLIDNDMGVFQDPKNAQILPYEKKKWEVPFDTLAMLEVIGAGKY